MNSQEETSTKLFFSVCCWYQASKEHRGTLSWQCQGQAFVEMQMILDVLPVGDVCYQQVLHKMK